jgi:transposase
MTDHEWACLEPFLSFRRGRPALDRRRTWDGIFWVACSTQPWSAMPPEFGNPGTCHSAMLYALHKGVLERLLLLISPHPFGTDALQSLEWRICRTFRRASRQLGPYGNDIAERLGMASAMTVEPENIPAPVTAWPMPPPDRVPRIPRMTHRRLRGLPPHPRTPIHLMPLPPRRRPGLPRRDEQSGGRRVRKAVKR